MTHEELPDIDRWFPVARSDEVERRHVVQAQLLGQEIALWRDDAGGINAWENRCPHRGVRLSIGFNLGFELRCQYHGWRYATGSGQCTFIPAHPNQKPASTIRANVFPAIELGGFLWVSLGRPAGAPILPAHVPVPTTTTATSPATGRSLTMRSIFVEAPATAVAHCLLHDDPAREDATRTGAAPPDDSRIDASHPETSVVAHDAFTFTAHTRTDGREATLIFLLQPVSASQTVIHALLQTNGVVRDRLAELHRHNARMNALRDDLERR